jgi:hypothetical protein
VFKFFKPLKLEDKKRKVQVLSPIVQKIIEEMEGLFTSNRKKKIRCKFYNSKIKNNGVRKRNVKRELTISKEYEVYIVSHDIKTPMRYCA